MNKKDYAFTFVIPIFKKIFILKKKYGKLSHEEQKIYMGNLLKNNVKNYVHEIFFEECENKSIHSHGSIFNISESEMEIIQENICKEIGLNKKEQFDYTFSYKKIFNYNIWRQYCTKNQNNNKEDDELKELEKELFG